MGIREKRTPDSDSRSRFTFVPYKSAIGSGLYYVLLRPTSEMRTFKAADNLFLLELSLREREL